MRRLWSTAVVGVCGAAPSCSGTSSDRSTATSPSADGQACDRTPIQTSGVPEVQGIGRVRGHLRIAVPDPSRPGPFGGGAEDRLAGLTGQGDLSVSYVAARRAARRAHLWPRAARREQLPTPRGRVGDRVSSMRPAAGASTWSGPSGPATSGSRSPPEGRVAPHPPRRERSDRAAPPHGLPFLVLGSERGRREDLRRIEAADRGRGGGRGGCGRRTAARAGRGRG